MPNQYDYEFRPTNDQRQRTQYGVVVTFNEGLTREQVDEIIDLMADQLGDAGQVSHVSKFNPEYSSPVFYCP